MSFLSRGKGSNKLLRWKAKDLHKGKLTKEDAKFIFEQAEKQVKDSIESAAVIVSRTNTLLTVVAGLIIAITAYIIKKWFEQNIFDDLLISAVIGDTYLFTIGFLSVLNIQPLRYDPVGSLPKDLLSDPFFHESIPDNERIIRYYVSESEDYQVRIEKNNANNSNRWKVYKLSLWAFLITPIIFALAYYLVSLL